MNRGDVVILAGHGSADEEDSGLTAVVRWVHDRMHPGCTDECVRPAYLQFMKPGLAEAIDAAVMKGARKIIIHPYFLASGFHVSRHIPLIIADARERHPGVDFLCTGHLGAHEKMAEVVLERIASALMPLQSPGECRDGDHE